MPEPGAIIIGRARRMERQYAAGVARREAMRQQRELATASRLNRRGRPGEWHTRLHRAPE